MAFVNFATREITAKIVYYGPGLGGKTTSLQYIHGNLAPENRGKMISLATEEDRTIYFDFLPLNLGKIQDFSVRVQLYTVPGQVRYNATRKLVLRGADGLVFVSDSQKHKKLANLESFNNMEENLRELSKDLRELPHILQFNKVDLPGIMSFEELNQVLNKYNVPFFETVATTGIGVLDALKSVTKLVFNDLSKKALLQKKSRSTLTTGGAPSSATEYTLGTSFSGTSAAAVRTAPPPAPVVPPPPPPEPVPQISSFYAEKLEPEEIVQEDLIEKVEDTYSSIGYSELELDQDSPSIKDTAYGEDLDRIAEVEPIEEFDEPIPDVPELEDAVFDDSRDADAMDIPADESIPGEEDAEFSVEEPVISVPIIPVGAKEEAEEAQVEPPPPLPTSAEPEQAPIPEPTLETPAPVTTSEPAPVTVSMSEPVPSMPEPVTAAPPAGLSYAQLFNDAPEFAELMRTMETQIASGEGKSALATARTAYEYLLYRQFPETMALDNTEISRVLALELKFKRFVRFKSLLWGDPAPRNLLLVHNFLCEVYLSLQEL